MPKLKRYYFDKLENETVVLRGQEMTHCRSVMRQNVGDEIIACCGDGLDYHCAISKIDKDSIQCQILDTKTNVADPKINVALFQAYLKSDKVELIVQKASEIGVKNFTLFSSEFCTAKQSDKSNKLERLNKIAIESAKQCGRSTILNITPPLTFDEMVNTLSDFECVLFAYEGQRTNKITEIAQDYNKIAVVIGSEGGFSPSEYNTINALKNVQCVTLGNRILRAETASLVATALAMERFEK